MRQNTRATVFVVSPNEYSDVFDMFYRCFEKFWENCPYKLVLATNNQEHATVRVINNYKERDTWADRAISGLQQIKTKYVLLFCDDEFIIEKVDNNKVEAVLDIMDQYNINFCRLKPLTRKGKRIVGSSDLLLASTKVLYARNILKGIWNREYLLSLLGNGGKTAWNLETEWFEEALNYSDEFYQDIAVVDKDIIRTVHGISKGKWFPSAKKELEKAGMWEESRRETLKMGEELKIIVISRIGRMLPIKMRKRIKNILGVMGIKFATKS